MVDLSLTTDEQEEAMESMAPDARPRYPYGCCIFLDEKTLEKLDLDTDVDVGDTIDLRAFGEVTGVHKSGDSCRVEIQLIRMAVENEADEEPGDEEC
jgi:hypothetical protein